MKLHGGPNLARGPEFDTHDLLCVSQKRTTVIHDDRIFQTERLQEMLISSKQLPSYTLERFPYVFRHTGLRL